MKLEVCKVSGPADGGGEGGRGEGGKGSTGRGSWGSNLKGVLTVDEVSLPKNYRLDKRQPKIDLQCRSSVQTFSLNELFQLFSKLNYEFYKPVKTCKLGVVLGQFRFRTA